jgi:hypothetical protein
MTSNTHGPQFTWADIEQWTEQGLIAPEQADAIRRHVEAVGPAVEQVQAGPEQRRGLNLVTVAYYFGAFMILLAYTFFMGIQWGSLSAGAQAAISAGTIGGLWAIGYVLRRVGFATAGNLLIFAGTGIVPLLVHTIQRATGLWPDQRAADYSDFYRLILPSWVLLEVISIAVALVVVWLTRFPLVMLLIAFWSWFLSMDLVRWLTDSPTWSWGDEERTISILMGAGMLVIGVILQRVARKDYSLWLYLFGHVIVLAHLGWLSLEHEGAVSLLFPVTYLAFVIASVWLQRRVFLVFGAIGCYIYVSYLAFRVFEGALGFVFALGAVGLLIVFTAVGHQKYVRGWLERRLERYRALVAPRV